MNGDIIGKGTFCEVRRWKGRAIKTVIQAGVCGTDYEAERGLHTEETILRRVHAHPTQDTQHVVRLLASELTAPLRLELELCEGSLDQLIYRYPHGDMPETLVRTYARQLMTALVVLRQHGVVHRDIKPHNLLLKGDVLKVADFGSACVLDEEVKSAAALDVVRTEGQQPACGAVPYSTPRVTLWYRAPEILLHLPSYSFPVDMWAAACVVAEMLRGCPLFSIIHGSNTEEREQLHQIIRALGYPSTSMMRQSCVVTGRTLFSRFVNTDNPECEEETFCLAGRVPGPGGIQHVQFDDELGERCPADLTTSLRQALQLDPDERLTPEEWLATHGATTRDDDDDDDDHEAAEVAATSPATKRRRVHTD